MLPEEEDEVARLRTLAEELILAAAEKEVAIEEVANEAEVLRAELQEQRAKLLPDRPHTPLLKSVNTATAVALLLALCIAVL